MLGKHIHNFCPTGTEVNRQMEIGHHWCPINFGQLGPNLSDEKYIVNLVDNFWPIGPEVETERIII